MNDENESANMNDKTIAWIKLITVAVSTGCTLGGAAYAGGAKLGYAIVVGIGAASSAVGHALSDSPNKQP